MDAFSHEEGNPLEALKFFRSILISKEEVESIVRESREEIEKPIEK